MLNDIGEFVFGHEFSVDTKQGSFMKINVDLVLSPSTCLFLSSTAASRRGRVPGTPQTIGIHHDGTKFDVGQATALKEHTKMLSARQAVAQSRNSRGFLTTLFQWTNVEPYFPRYKHEPDVVNLHITTLRHGYSSHEQVDHNDEPLPHHHRIFLRPYFPDITQPLDNSLEVTHEPFVAYQYFLHVVPTTYIAPRSAPLHTNQYSVTHYTRVLSQHSGTPGIFFKFDLDPMSLTIHQRTSTFLQLVIREGKGVMRTLPVVVSEARATRWQGSVQQRAGRSGHGRWGARRGRGGAHSARTCSRCSFVGTHPPLARSLPPLPSLLHIPTPPLPPCSLADSPPNPLLPVSRCVGVIGGVFVCMGYALKVTTAAVSALVDNSADEIPPAVASASALRTKFSGASLTKRARPSSGRLVPQGNGWVMESAPGSPVPYGGASSPYSGTPVSSTFPPPSPFSPASPYPGSPSGFPGSQPGTPGTGYGPPPMSARSSSGLGPGGHPRTPAGSVGNAAAMGIQPPGTPQYGIFPPTPGPAQTGFNVPPPPAGNKRLSMNGSPGAEKKKDD
ncbi:endoplasmic reticulum vesicle transporter-domain-containing protein [Mycena galopus ATCC 62051]|nr:endoplasmic reticulum vesicle transporter-domain-containing protein [Mycena galopus ATCC 62051]